MIEDLRRLEREIERLEKLLRSEESQNYYLKLEINRLKNQLVESKQALEESQLGKKLIIQLKERIEENKLLFKLLFDNLKKELYSRNEHKFPVYLENVLDAQEEIIKNSPNSFAQKQLNKYRDKLVSDSRIKDEINSLLEKQKKIIDLEKELEEILQEKEIKNLVEASPKW